MNLIDFLADYLHVIKPALKHPNKMEIVIRNNGNKLILKVRKIMEN